MKRKIYRAAIALLLVSVLVVSWSPIQVRASAAAPAVEIIKQVVPLAASGGASAAGGATLGTAAFSYVVGGLGVVVGGAALLTMVDRYMEYSNEMDTAIYYYPDGTWSYGVDVGFVDRVRAFLFDCGYLDSPDVLCTTVAEGETFFGRTPRVPCVGYAYSYCLIIDGVYRVYSRAYLLSTIPNERFIVSETTPVNTAYSVTYNGMKYYFHVSANGQKNYTSSEYTIFTTQPSEYYHFGEFSSDIDMGFQKVFDKYGWSGIAGNGDVAIDYVAAPDVPMDTAYPDWYANVRYATDADTDDEKPILPIPLKPKADYVTQAESVTQTDVWQGTIEEAPAITSPEVIPGTVGLADILQSIKAIPAALADVITGPIVGGLSKIGDLVVSIPQAIAEAISAIFVPSADFLEAKVATLKARFPFIDGIIGLGEFVSESLSSDLGPPVLYVDFGPATTDTYGHKKYLLTDFSWYAPYKPTVDALMSSILWAFYGWRIFVRLPSIIGGEGGQVINVAFHSASARNAQEAERDRKKHKGG